MIWLALGAGAVVFRTVQLCFIRNPQTGLVWATKILTDPFNDFRQYMKAPLYLMKGELIDPMIDVRQYRLDQPDERQPMNRQFRWWFRTDALRSRVGGHYSPGPGLSSAQAVCGAGAPFRVAFAHTAPGGQLAASISFSTWRLIDRLESEPLCHHQPAAFIFSPALIIFAIS